MTTISPTGLRMANSARRWTIALLGALFAIGLGTLTTDVAPTVDQPATDQALTLGGITTLEQTFSTTRAGLIGLSIPVSAGAASDSDFQLSIRVRYDGGPPIDLVSASAPLSAAGDQLLSFTFPAPIDARAPRAISDTFRLYIDIPALPPSSGPAIGVQVNAQQQGRLRIDGRPAAGFDLVIIPRYRQRLIDRLWPISAMSAGKPGVLAWPPLYVLIPYIYLILLLEAATALYRAIRPPVDA